MIGHFKRVMRSLCWILLLPLVFLSGCGLSEAIVDGLYGGISDTVAGVISELLRGAGPDGTG